MNKSMRKSLALLLGGVLVLTGLSGSGQAEEPVLVSPSEPKKEEGQKIYKVQVGNFAAYEEAQKTKELLAKEFSGLFIARRDHLFRVQVGAFASEEKAQDLLRKLQSGGYKAYVESQ